MQPGDRIVQYEITGTLGAGGMGVVYAADDTRLHRAVALKFLPRAWSQDADAKARFLREARSASGLDHPNIYTIYEIGETPDGAMYIVTPLYDGVTLKERVGHGPLPVSEIESIAKQLFSALEAAHGAGIVHRDVKPANIVVTKAGVVKLIDFGLAKLGVDAQLTQDGATLGTVAYMSPEQASGHATDHRTDLWSAGVVLYQMLTGRLPFAGDYDQAIMYSILNVDPTPVSTHRKDVPEPLDRLVEQLLRKSPDERISSARVALESLSDAEGQSHVPTEKKGSRWRKPVFAVLILCAIVMASLVVWTKQDTPAPPSEAIPPSKPGRASIAIMPFSNLSPDTETDFLGYALADQIIGSLSYVKELLVRPSSSIRPFVGKAYSTRSAGEELAVDYLLNGTYQRQENEMRLTIELVDVGSDQIIWREPVQLEYDNAFQIQDAVSQKVLGRLQVEFSEAERVRMTYDVPKDPLAYDYYLKAISSPETQTGNSRAVEMLERSIEIDSTFAPAWDQLGFRWQRIGHYDLGGIDPTEKAREAFLKALDLNPGLLSALGNLASLYTDFGRSLESIRLADRLLEINPSSAIGHFARGYAFRYVGMTNESVREMSIALALDSTDNTFRSAGISYIIAGDLDRAERAFRVDEGSHYYDGWMGEIFVRRGQVDDAIEVLDRVARDDPDGLMGQWSIGIVSALTGNYEAGLAAARKWESAHIVDAEGQYYNAGMYCLNKDADACIRVLRRAIDHGYFNVDNLLHDRFMETARDDPRFESMLSLAREKQAEFRGAYDR